MKHIAAALVATQLAGCSFMFSHPPAPLRPGRPVEPCSASRVAPTLDLYQAIGSGILALTLLSLSGDDMSESDDGLAVMMGLVSAGAAVGHGASASYGYRQARACREQQAYVYEAVLEVPAVEVPTEEVEIEEETEIHTRIKSRTRVRPIVKE